MVLQAEQLASLGFKRMMDTWPISERLSSKGLGSIQSAPEALQEAGETAHKGYRAV